jgi:uncharacterized membrane protein YdfJ with MMPL/SSD domain
MGLPVVTALFGIGAGLSLIALLGHVFPAPSFSPIIAAMIGLGVGVDYALFIVTRFREGLRAGRTPQDAATIAMRTAGRSVLVAGTTVVIGMMGLLVLRQPLMNGVAVAAAATVAMTVLGFAVLIDATAVRMVLVPAVMELLGKANWWLSAPLARILPASSLAENEPPAGAQAPVPASRAAG